MYSDQLKSELAGFIAMRTDNMRKIRDHIPSGPEHFSFFHGEREMNWYEFWDHIAEHRPHQCKLKTHLFLIEFNEPSLKWEVSDCPLDQGIRESANIVTKELNKYEEHISLLRQWVKYQAIKK